MITAEFEMVCLRPFMPTLESSIEGISLFKAHRVLLQGFGSRRDGQCIAWSPLGKVMLDASLETLCEERELIDAVGRLDAPGGFHAV